jgi:hypothetical protein
MVIHYFGTCTRLSSNFLNFVLQVTDGTNPKFPASITFQSAEDLVNDTLFLRVSYMYTSMGTFTNLELSMHMCT